MAADCAVLDTVHFVVVAYNVANANADMDANVADLGGDSDVIVAIVAVLSAKWLVGWMFLNENFNDGFFPHPIH